MHYVVTGGTGFIGRRVVYRDSCPPRRRTGVGTGPPRVARQRSNGSPQTWGDRGETTGRRPDRGRPRLWALSRRRSSPNSADSRPRGALRRDLRHHRPGGPAAGRQRRRHPCGDRAGPPAGRDAAPRVVDRGRRAPIAASTPRTISTSPRNFRRRITRRSSRPSCWSARRSGLRYRVYRPAVVVGDSRTGEMDKVDGPYYFFGVLAKLAALPRFTPMVLPDTGRTNIVPGGLRGRRDRRADARRRPRRPDVPPHRAEDHRAARHLPRRRAGRRAAAAARVAAARRPRPPFLQATRTRQGVAQHGGHPARHPRRDPRRRRPGADVHRANTPQKRCAAPGSRCPSSPSYAPQAVAVLGRAPRPGPGPPRRPGRAAGRAST